jgi:anti-anti-sigma factor
LDFEVSETEVRGKLILSVRGELDLDTAGELRRRLEPRNGTARDAVVDLSGCAFIDSTGISLLVRAFRRAVDGDAGRLVLVATPGGQVRKTLRLTNVDSRIPVFGSLEAALA